MKYEEKSSKRGLFRITAQISLGFAGLWTIGFVCGGEEALTQMKAETMSVITLPKPTVSGTVSLEEAISRRRSERTFQDHDLTLKDLSQLLWAAQGKTDAGGFRTAPSAGAQYPLDIYVVVGKVKGLGKGSYHYDPQDHSLILVHEGELRPGLARACLGQMFMADAPVIIVITAEYERITDRYGERGVRYAHMEVGHVGQNIYLQAQTLGLGTVAVGAFRDRGVSGLLGLPEKHRPLYVMPVGYVR